jgi:hypothetical protein
MKKNIIFFDVETNGKVGSAVLSISAIKVSYDFENDSWEKVSEYDRFYFRNEGESFSKSYDTLIAEIDKTALPTLPFVSTSKNIIFFFIITSIL